MPKQTDKPTQALVLSDFPKVLLARAKRIADSQDPRLDRNVWIAQAILERVDQEEKRLGMEPIPVADPVAA
jgi:hypothetical protein